MLKVRRNQVRRLVLAYFERLGAEIEDMGGDLYRVEMSPEQSGELEGGWTPPSGPWSLNSPTQITYYFTFTPEVAEAREEAELIGLGSQRFQQVIQSIRKIGGVTRAWLPAPVDRFGASHLSRAAVFYRPFYLFTLRLDFVNTAKPSEIARVAVDRVDQIALTQAAEILCDLPLESGYPRAADIESATIDFEGSFEVAYESVLQLLEGKELDWAYSAQRAIDQERQRLTEYFDLREQDGEEVSEERDRRLLELEATRPRVIVRVQGASELYLPVVWEEGSLRQLAFETAGYRSAPIP